MKLEITDDSGNQVFKISTLAEQTEDKDKLVNCLILEAAWHLMEEGKLNPENLDMYAQHFINRKKGLVP